MTTEDTRDGGMQVVSRAAAILRMLSSNSGSSLGAIAKATGLPRSTVQRIVDALAAENLVEAGAAGVRLGWGMLQLAQSAQTEMSARARSALEALFAATHETVDLAVGHGAEVSFLDRIDSDRELRVVPINNRPRPMHAMANGKAILSTLSNDEIERMMSGRMPALTARTLQSMPALVAEVEEIRRTGLAYDREEHAPGVCAIAVPIVVRGLRTHAVSVAMPSNRFEESLPSVQKALIACRAAIEREAIRG
ncbi:IclR family acetate operon transcriptional repressor [Paraburkholderia sp. EB58]|jgi:IclR family transcriptional regulator, acetate operon repressor|uniref:IclR family transcriptional regulator n=1 Tax=Paraburkholderia sp. EB58 TaxID=3035125 RepID=UPI003D23B47D